MTSQQAAELIELLREVEALGLSFDCGTAYIRRSYIDKQADLRKRIDAAAEFLAAQTTEG